jgi:asparagine synthase (glutamine-hydrolysing)
MCGICGILNIDGDKKVDSDQLKKMTQVIIHRGPDDVGYYVKDNIGLGIRRLSIIDLVTGHQPISSEDQSIWVVLNGEIYNFLELRDNLIKKGHSFRTKTDTETIVHLYEEYGLECVKHLRGMFCFAIWDDKRKRLVLAKDRIGIKPLYYSVCRDQLLFGSEIKCILQHPRFERKIDSDALKDYFTFLYVPAPKTIFSGIFKLLPGHILVQEDKKLTIEKYWEVKYETFHKRSEDYFVEGFLEKLKEAVRMHLLSDVPLGAFLSGGIDSSSVVALMSQVATKPVMTFSIGYPDENRYFDERKEAREVAEKFGTQHQEFIVKPDLVDILPKSIKHFDEPFADSSFIPNYYISQLAREKVKVALSGLGGDELSAGYVRYLGVILGEYYNKLPSSLKRMIKSLITSLPQVSGDNPIISRAKRFVKGVALLAQHSYLEYISAFNQEDLSKLLSGDVRKETEKYDPQQSFFSYFSHAESDDMLNKMLFLDFKTYLPDDLLTLTDRMSMAHSLEIRVPFLDHQLIEFLATVPPQLKIKNLQKKYIHKKAVSKILPKEILQKKKKGFSLPLGSWFRKELKEFVQEVLTQDQVEKTGLFNQEYINQILKEHLSFKADHESKLIALLVFIIWFDIYMTRKQI